MEIIKKLNNNVVLALNDQNQEVIVVGKGLGFGKIPYTIDEESEAIQHVYIKKKNNQLVDAFINVPDDVVIVTEKIINIAKAVLHYDLNKSILVTLSDHLSYAIERKNKGMIFNLPFETDIRSIYSDEVTVAKVALEIIKSDLDVALPEEEISFIALHLIGAQHDIEGMKETYKLTKTIAHIMSIIEDHYQMVLDKNSLFYSRFSTHLRFFVFRQKKGITFPKGSMDFLYDSIQDDKNLNACIDKIAQFIEEEYGWICSNEERAYLMLHIKSLVYSKGVE